eukprot:6717440-Pyramimonas_sp.AAC.1
MVLGWFASGSGMAHGLFGSWLGRANGDTRGSNMVHGWFEDGSRVVLGWFASGSRVAQWHVRGSEEGPGGSLVARVVQKWFTRGSRM